MHTTYLVLLALVAFLVLRQRNENYTAKSGKYLKRTFTDPRAFVTAVITRLRKTDKEARKKRFQKFVRIATWPKWTVVTIYYKAPGKRWAIGARFWLKGTARTNLQNNIARLRLPYVKVQEVTRKSTTK